MPVAKAKPAPKRAAKPAAKAAARKPAARKAPAAAQNGNGRLTHEDKLALVPEVVKKLKAGTTFAQIRQEYVSSGMRAALAEKGYDTQGNKLVIEEISTSGGSKAFAKRVANARIEGMPWFKVVLATGKTEGELKQLLADNGYGDLAAGRVTTADEAPTTRRAPAKKAAAAKKATPAKAPAKKVTPRAKAAPAAAVKAKPRPRRVARPQ
jgi:phosphoglycolate phosphatase-like HAD superfamily hydrolase